MTGRDFVLFVKAKLNRLDSSAYEDVRPEEIFLFAQAAQKKLTLSFDVFRFSQSSDKENLNVYLASITKSSGQVMLTDNEVALPLVLKLKDVAAYVAVTPTNEAGWVSTREVTNQKTTSREGNTFEQSYPDTPAYRLIDGKIKFDKSPIFSVEKIRYEYLEYPSKLTFDSIITFPFVEELQDMTVTLILENLENRRISTQPTIART